MSNHYSLARPLSSASKGLSTAGELVHVAQLGFAPQSSLATMKSEVKPGIEATTMPGAAEPSGSEAEFDVNHNRVKGSKLADDQSSPIRQGPQTARLGMMTGYSGAPCFFAQGQHCGCDQGAFGRYF